MKDLYQIAKITRQALWKCKQREQKNDEKKRQVVALISDMRSRHKRMGCRKIYSAVKKKSPVGRDIFEALGHAYGYKLKLKRNVKKTTWTQRVEVHPNLLAGKKLNGINQAWQSDIFYLKVENKDYYGVAIIDVYSRKLLALVISPDLKAERNVKALKQALRNRKGKSVIGCIFHSDRGSQYISSIHKALLRKKRMRISMCKLPQENAYVERVQGTLKYEYLFEFKLTEKNLPQMIRRIMHYYNYERPHENLQKFTPAAFEEYVAKLPKKSRPVLEIHKGFVQSSATYGHAIDKLSFKGIHHKNMCIKKRATSQAARLQKTYSSGLSYPSAGCSPAKPASVSLNNPKLNNKVLSKK